MQKKIIVSMIFVLSFVCASITVRAFDDEKAFKFAREKTVEEPRAKLNDTTVKLTSLGVAAVAGVVPAAVASFFAGIGQGVAFSCVTDFLINGFKLGNVSGTLGAGLFGTAVIFLGGYASVASSIFAYKKTKKIFSDRVDFDMAKDFIHNLLYYKEHMPEDMFYAEQIRVAHERYQELIKANEYAANSYLKTITPELVEIIKKVVYKHYPEEFADELKGSNTTSLSKKIMLGALFIVVGYLMSVSIAFASGACSSPVWAICEKSLYERPLHGEGSALHELLDKFQDN